MGSNSEDLLQLINETKKYVSHIHELGVQLVGTNPTSPSAVELKPASPVRQIPDIEPPPLPIPVKTVVKQKPAAPEALFVDVTSRLDPFSPSLETFEGIHAEIGDCTRCPLHLKRTHVVNTEGNRKARLMFVGEAPGADEDIQARPFVGRARGRSGG